METLPHIVIGNRNQPETTTQVYAWAWWSEEKCGDLDEHNHRSPTISTTGDGVIDAVVRGRISRVKSVSRACEWVRVCRFRPPFVLVPCSRIIHNVSRPSNDRHSSPRDRISSHHHRRRRRRHKRFYRNRPSASHTRYW